MPHYRDIVYFLREKELLDIKQIITDENATSATCHLVKRCDRTLLLYANIHTQTGVKYRPIVILYCFPFVQMPKPKNYTSFFGENPIPYKTLKQLAFNIVYDLKAITHDSQPMNPAHAFTEQRTHIFNELDNLYEKLANFFEEINYPLGREEEPPPHYKQYYYTYQIRDFNYFRETQERLTFETYSKRCGASLLPEELTKFENIECVLVYEGLRAIYVIKDGGHISFENGMYTTRKFVTIVNAFQIYARNNLSKVEKRLYKNFLKG